MKLDTYKLELMRQTWRSPPKQYKVEHPDLVSLVSISDSGHSIGVFRRGSAFVFKRGRKELCFGKLSNAEIAAFEYLYSIAPSLGE